MTEVILIRHGQKMPKVSFNDHDGAKLNLTEYGKLQAIATGEFLSPISNKLIKCYSSDYPRCIQTAEAINAQLQNKWNIIKDQRLRERVLNTKDYIEPIALENQQQAHSNYDWAPTGGETRNQVIQRFNNFEKSILEEHGYQRDQIIVVVTHGRALQYWLHSKFQGQLPSEYDEWDLVIKTCSITQISYIDNQNPVLEILNNTDHLKNLGEESKELIID